MNLLTDPLFRVETPSGLAWLDLPGVLEVLANDQVAGLPGVQRHQEDALHIFLCYLSAAVLVREDQANPRQTAAFWREGIRRLTHADGGDDDSAWTLVVADPTRPAFMQPPCKTIADFNQFKPKASTPAELDLLPTAKNHDVKSRRLGQAESEDWIYALVSLQTMSGFFGKGNYGIARMNGGFGSRSVIAVDAATSLGTRWLDHTTRLLGLRQGVLQGVWGFRAQGLVCTWIPPWNLTTSLSLDQLDPFFIEVCRPLRLTTTSGRVLALGTGSNGPRIAAQGSKGVLGDPWSPINQSDKEPSVLTLSASGFTPSLLRNLIFQDGFTLTPLQLPVTEQNGKGCTLSASVLVRGQGTTEGFHQIQVPIPGPSARRLFRRGAEYDQLASLSKTAIEDSGVMQNKVLKTAIYALLEAGPTQVDFDKREVSAWWGMTQLTFTNAWSADYFPWLWRTMEAPDAEAARLEWLRALRAKAETALATAIARYPARTGRRYRAQVRAQGIFNGLMYKHFPQLAPARSPDEEFTRDGSNTH